MGDFVKISDIVTKHELRFIPTGEGLNQDSSIPELRNIGQNFYWSAILGLINSQPVSEERIIDIIQFFIKNGFDPKSVLGQVPELSMESIALAPESQQAMELSPLVIAYERGLLQVVTYLLSDSFLNYWHPAHFILFTKILTRQKDLQGLTDLFRTSFAVNSFNLAFNSSERATFI